MREIFRSVVVLTNLLMVYVISGQALAIFRPASKMMETKICRFCFAEIFHTHPPPHPRHFFGRRGLCFECDVRERERYTAKHFMFIDMERRVKNTKFVKKHVWLVGLC